MIMVFTPKRHTHIQRAKSRFLHPALKAEKPEKQKKIKAAHERVSYQTQKGSPTHCLKQKPQNSY
jgi:hypothetical protein